MLNKKIVYTNSEGNCSVVSMAPDMFNPESGTRKNLEAQGITFATDEEVMAFIIKKSIPEGTTYKIIDATALPADRTFREAWTVATDKVKEDLEKAKIIHLNRLRVIRNKQLDKTDILLMKAQEQGTEEDVATLKTDRQALRDMPETTDLSTITKIKDLKEVMPEVLTKYV